MRNGIKIIVLVMVLLVGSFSTFGANSSGEQDLATFSDPSNVGGDPGASPINDYLIPMLLLGIVSGYRLCRKKTQEVK